MGRRKDPSEWTPAYRARMERGAREGKSKSEARGFHPAEAKAKQRRDEKLAETYTNKRDFNRAKSIQDIERKQSSLTLKMETGQVKQGDAAMKTWQILEDVKKTLKTIFNEERKKGEKTPGYDYDKLQAQLKKQYKQLQRLSKKLGYDVFEWKTGKENKDMFYH